LCLVFINDPAFGVPKESKRLSEEIGVLPVLKFIFELLAPPWPAFEVSFLVKSSGFCK
jgi:hypothetical protein